MAFVKRVFPLAFLMCMGAAVPLLLLFLGAELFGVLPLSDGEQSSIANYHHLNYDNLDPLCQMNRKFRGGKNQIAVFGGSSAEGAKATYEKDFPTQLQVHWARRFPGAWTIHNLARSAKTSFWVKECMKAAAKEQARYWVVYEGHNDFVDIQGGGVDKIYFLLKHPWSYRALQWALSTRISGWLRPLIRPAPIPSSWAEHHAATNRVLKISEANYREMIATAKASGTKLILATVISNLMWEPSFYALEGTPDGLDATKAFKLAKEQFRLKNYDEALRLFRLARDRDINAWRAPSSFNALIRRLAAEFPKEVLLLDLESAFESEFKQREIGCDFFGSKTYCDQLHPNDFTHSWIMKQLEKLLLSAEAS